MADANLSAGDSVPPANPVTCLRDWLDRLSGSRRLAITRPGVDLRFKLAAVAKRLDGHQASFFPAPSGHSMPVVSGLVSSRDWIAEAMAVRSREMLSHFEAAVAAPRRPRLVDKAPVQAVVHRSDPAEVEWAVVTRSQADRDLIVISESQVSKLDPSAEGGVGAKMGIDATVACDAPEMRFKRIRVPGEEAIDLRQVLVPEGDWRRLAEGA